MSDIMDPLPTPGDIEDIVRQVLEEFLGMPALAHGEPATFADNACGARVSISGAWNGHIDIGCNTGMARRLGATMFRTATETVSPAQVQDALDEIANIVGGNLKALLPAPCRLSLPEFLPHVRSVLGRHGLRVCLNDNGGDYFWVAIDESATAGNGLSQ